MKKIVMGIIVLTIALTGCSTEHNFMNVDNPNAKDDLKSTIGSGNLQKINTDNIIPDSLSGKRNDAKGYANRYYEDTLEEYVDAAKDGLSGTSQKIKGYYNSGVDQLNGIITESVSGLISGELNKIKVK